MPEGTHQAQMLFGLNGCAAQSNLTRVSGDSAAVAALSSLYRMHALLLSLPARHTSDTYHLVMAKSHALDVQTEIYDCFYCRRSA